MNSLSESVADGNSYKGVYFKLSNDIDSVSYTHLYILQKKTVIKQSKKEYKKLNVHNVIFGIVFVILFVLTQCLFCGRYDNWKNYVAQTISILFIAVAMFNFCLL